MSTKSEDKMVWCRTEFSTGKNAWQFNTQWMGWERVIGFALCFNLKRPAVLFQIFGWNLHFGNLPLVQRHEIPIESRVYEIDIASPSGDQK